MPHEWDAATYDRIADPQARWGQAVIGRLALDGDETVLDAGCGTGRVTAGVLDLLPHGRVVALDGSAAMLGQARERLAGSAGRLSFLHADLRQHLPLATGCLDAIVSTATFHWIPDHQALFGHLARVVRPGGALVAQCGGAGNIASVYRALDQVAPGEAYPKQYATAELTAERLQRAGFVDVETWLHPEPTPYATREDLERFLATVVLWPQLRVRPPEEHGAFVAAVADRLPALELDYVRLNIMARKA
ncbi:MAG TPA: class I SAM-dependent methyltransferase [Actinomycetota bacterium]|nr:class I SAM-dependent methyltransferase [Actinomycetota bacterium]